MGVGQLVDVAAVLDGEGASLNECVFFRGGDG